jgi:hypothetical protein
VKLTFEQRETLIKLSDKATALSTLFKDVAQLGEKGHPATKIQLGGIYTIVRDIVSDLRNFF